MDRYLKRVKDALGAELQDEAVPRHAVERRRHERRAGRAQTDHDGLVGTRGGRARQRGDRGMAGFENIVTLDAGGTSTDLSLIEGGKRT
jgi:N-methylhydantoinase A